MAALVPYVYLLIGLILLSVAADFLIRGAVDLASRLEISPLVVGLTVVAFGTSLPELVVCVQAALEGAPGIAVGNVVGSNIANILLIIGAGAIIFPISANRSHFLRDSAIMIAATLVFVGFALTGSIGALAGGFMLAGLIGFILFSYAQGKKFGAQDLTMIDMDEATADTTVSVTLAVAWVMGGLAGVAVGADLLVDGATNIARSLGVSEEVIGLTMVAIGTSLPELATVVAAAAKKHTDVIVGNVMGSNIFNIFGVMGATAVVSDVPVLPQILTFDIWVMLTVAVLLVPVMISGHVLSRREGTVFLVLYGAYITVQYLGVESLI